MTLLTPKQQSYADQRILGLDPSDAYKASDYKSDAMTPGTIKVEAAKLEKNPNITLTVQIARDKAAETVGLTLISHLERLKELSNAAEAENQFGAAITAETNRGKASGLYTEKHEVTGKGGNAIEYKDVTDEDLERRIANLKDSTDDPD